MEVKTSVQVGLGVCGSIRKEMEFGADGIPLTSKV